MATAKKEVVTSKRYSVQAKLTIDVGMEIQASSLEDAAMQAAGLDVSDFIDFNEQGLEHNDSEKPDVYGIFRA